MQSSDAPRRWFWAGLTAAVAIVGLGAKPAHCADGPTFDQVMAAPDDPGLNFDYARTEADSGNLLTAAAAMERVLDARPGWTQARLFYTGVLLRLDDLQDARVQLKLLEGADMTDQQRQEADDDRRQVGPWGGGRP